MSNINTVIFDLGGVLVDWNPDHLYTKVFDDPEKMKWFYKNVCTSEWNLEQDAGRPLQEATDILVKQFDQFIICLNKKIVFLLRSRRCRIPF